MNKEPLTKDSIALDGQQNNSAPSIIYPKLEVEDDKQQLAKRKRASYAKITDEQRKRLLDLVVIQKYDMKKASVEVGIHISTATAIVKTFLEEGRIGKKKTKQKMGQFVQNFFTNKTPLPPEPVQDQKLVMPQSPVFTAVNVHSNPTIAMIPSGIGNQWIPTFQIEAPVEMRFVFPDMNTQYAFRPR